MKDYDSKLRDMVLRMPTNPDSVIMGWITLREGPLDGMEIPVDTSQKTLLIPSLSKHKPHRFVAAIYERTEDDGPEGQARYLYIGELLASP